MFQPSILRCKLLVSGRVINTLRPVFSDTVDGSEIQRSPVEVGKVLHPGRKTWNLQITHLERKMIFRTSMLIFRGVYIPAGFLAEFLNHQEYYLGCGGLNCSEPRISNAEAESTSIICLCLFLPSQGSQV